MSNNNELDDNANVRNRIRARADAVCANQTARGFSLIEMLVVLLIIVILISILLPAISRARELARTAACAASLRSLGQVTLLYVNQQDHKHFYEGKTTGSLMHPHCAGPGVG